VPENLKLLALFRLRLHYIHFALCGCVVKVDFKKWYTSFTKESVIGDSVTKDLYLI
jgi:hypothetical protein